MSEFVFEKTFNFGGAALFLIAPWFIMVLSLIVYLLLGYEKHGHGQRTWAYGTCRGHRQKAQGEGMCRGY
jgi:uncharacterized membrane protein